MGGTDWYDRDGKPMTVEEASSKLHDMEYKRVGYATNKDICVSTVWLGLDHQWGPDGDPVIFETMVFRGKSWADIDCQRYSTLVQAEAGHVAFVLKMMRGDYDVDAPG